MSHKRRRCLSALLLVMVGSAMPAAWSQTFSGAEQLPPRNLQIEVRQIRDSSQSQIQLGASGVVVLQPGQSGGRVDITAARNQRSDSGDLVQRVLVLNGRGANIMLGNSVPLRLLQGYVRNGVVRYTRSTVLVDTNSGFSARPIWRGDNIAELELSAVQSNRNSAALPAQTSVVTTLALPLNEWVTVAQSDDAMNGSNSGSWSSGQTAAYSSLTVQVRMTAR
ncbi:MAG TPA: hypothetical protein VE934_08435 [Polaromonas sp.]|uniref:hypothetical protein n=1 Tax=Polaromonas sp. TaxID=1869339 RepID=UPI002D5FB501|nr:hypothetical protein [Polaromonas sp.]HYW56974.1 hypothetical protein [Polaromonas sp.]